MAKDPAFLFYSDNFQSGTQFFTDEQTGKYIRLLCAQHLHGHLQEKHMIHICRTYDKDIWSKFVKDEAGNYFNERLDFEILKRKNYSDSRATNRKSIKNKTKKPKNISSTYDKHMGNGNEIGNEIDNETAIENFLVPEMLKIYKKHLPNYKQDQKRDAAPLLSIAKFLIEQGKIEGRPEDNRTNILQAWEPLCMIIAKDNFFRTKPLKTISNQIQEITQIALHGKSDGKPNYGSQERAKEHDRMFAERYGNG